MSPVLHAYCQPKCKSRKWQPKNTTKNPHWKYLIATLESPKGFFLRQSRPHASSKAPSIPHVCPQTALCSKITQKQQIVVPSDQSGFAPAHLGSQLSTWTYFSKFGSHRPIESYSSRLRFPASYRDLL